MKKTFRVKTLEDGRSMLNLACGAKMNWEWNNLDFSPSARLAHHRTIAKVLKAARLLSEERYCRLSSIDPEILCWDLRRGIPFRNNTFDVVYSSHFLEHISKASASVFLRECYRVLKPDGIIRVVVPDLAAIVDTYVSSLSSLRCGNRFTLDSHLEAIDELFEQMVRRESPITAQQSPLARLLERFIRGDASNIGETHRWMYDEYSLGVLLLDVGFKTLEVRDYSTSRATGWDQFGLDTNENGSAYKSASLYMEATKQNG